MNPLTPGLLISMAIRNDHSFGIWMEGFEFEHSTLEEKQIALLREMLEYYRRGQQLSECASRTETQLWEEISGEGFYRPDRENWYQGSAMPAARLEAVRLVKGYENE